MLSVDLSPTSSYSSVSVQNQYSKTAEERMTAHPSAGIPTVSIFIHPAMTKPL